MISARAALLYGPGQDYKIDTVEYDEPRPGEVVVEMRACGMCHSDEHVRTGDLPLPHYPVINGHEGAGEVSQVGEGVTSVAPGDHGSESPRTQIPRLGNLYRDGILKLDELITETYSLDQVNQGYADIEAGRILRGVIAF